MSQLRYADFLTDLRTGRFHGVFVDDTGSPGLATTPGYLHPERKSWVAVVIPPNNMVEVLSQMPEAIEELRHIAGAAEFHFADIYGGKGNYKGVDLKIRLALFEFMAHIFTTYRFPVIVQTLDPGNVSDIHDGANLPKQVGPFNLTKQDDLALLFLLLRVKWFLENQSSSPGPWARVFVDEGFKKNGAAIRIPTLERYFVDGLVCFARSDIVQPIQLADFAAFGLNRTQLIRGKPELSELDRTLLQIMSPVAWNYQNIPKVTLDQLQPKDKTLH